MEDGSGWLADPDDDGQERYFDGAEWTSETRLVESDVPAPHLPDHVPELQRALAAATADIDEVEERLGRLFDRAEGVDPEVAKARRGSGLRRRAEAARAEAEAATAAVGAIAEMGEEDEEDEEVDEEPELQLVDDVVATREREAEARAAAEALADAAAAGPPTVESLLGTDEELEPELEFVDDEDDDEVDAEADDVVEVDDEDELEDEPELEVVDVQEPVHEAFADDADAFDEDDDEDNEIDVYAEGDGFDEGDEHQDKDANRGAMAELEVDDDAMAELDEALASEEPEKLRRGRRRRR